MVVSCSGAMNMLPRTPAVESSAAPLVSAVTTSGLTGSPAGFVSLPLAPT